MGKLILMCGVPGSGKSTYLKVHEPWFNESHVIVSRDEIRFSLLKEGEEYFSHEKEVWKIFVDKIKDGLSKVEEVYVDATHINEHNRAKLLRVLGKSMAGVELEAIYFDLPMERILAQNAQRTGVRFVPPSVIQNMRSTMTEPSFEEGFNRVYVVRDDGMVIRERDDVEND